MISFETMSFAMIILFCIVAIFRMIHDIKKNLFLLVPNLLFGGVLYVVFNLFGVSISLNVLTGTLITMLGASGLCLIVALKVIFNIF